jgi:hypothetical protein
VNCASALNQSSDRDHPRGPSLHKVDTLDSGFLLQGSNPRQWLLEPTISSLHLLPLEAPLAVGGNRGILLIFDDGRKCGSDRNKSNDLEIRGDFFQLLPNYRVRPIG